MKAKTKKVSKASKAAKKERSREAVVPDDARITVLAKSNPRRAGTLGARTFAAYKTGMTVGEWREVCRSRDLDAGYLHPNLRRGYIKVTLPAKARNGNGKGGQS